MHIGDISQPELIEAAEHYAAGRIGNHTPGIGCPRASNAAPACDWLASPHAVAADPPVAVVAMLESQALNGVAQPGLFLAGRRSLSADAGELAHALDSDLALRPGRRHRLDDFVDAVPPGTPLRRRCPLTCRKAC
jgi:hypothetical protein